jgi:hypothetical protein
MIYVGLAELHIFNTRGFDQLSGFPDRPMDVKVESGFSTAIIFVCARTPQPASRTKLPWETVCHDE